ncbi:16S rRNA m(7)G-527 methyltransferase [Terribacillus aidingensis]|uniref:Ribosomal RNA small subunit methyltransferase G n=1 Tax=Terribacillus aidingensis TaxID=586416 RepID=A0A285N2J9_9BACI|nr:16S rRNA (guanine(527)-N(7))-methyltransferase RsmG [Terribacillus aidingensis]SNZ02246.1 16S rRNA m(7)G-527 methyltransferase [Terribacillus aidingensis]
MNQTDFLQQLEQQGITLSDRQKQQLEDYFHLLVEWNEKMNLTAITEKGEVYLKHFYDSISAAFFFDFKGDESICDVGAGAGFPSIPLKIIYPDLKVTIVDSLKKRITFLNELATKLGLTNVAFYHDRAENFGKNDSFRESFDLVTARAVARMSVLSELCLPLCQTKGHFIAMKGPNMETELQDAESAIQLLGGELVESFTFDLPEEGGERNIAIIAKRRKTPKKYPRKAGVPNREPIE